MQQGFELIKTTMEQVFPSPVYSFNFVMVIAAAIYIFARRKTRGEKLLTAYTGVILVSFLLPPFAYVMAKFLREGDVYWRYLWLLPTAVVVPYAAVLLATERGRRWTNVLTGAVLALAIVLCGRNYYASGAFVKANGREKVAARTLIAVRAIEENIEATGNTYCFFAAPFEESHQFREVSSAASIYSRRFLDLTYLKENFPKWYYNITVLNRARTDEQHKTAKNLKKMRCNYVLIDSDAMCDEDLASRGYQVIYAGGGWNIWYHPDIISKKEARARREARLEREAKAAAEKGEETAEAEEESVKAEAGEP